MAVTACCCRWRRTNPPAATIAKNRPAASQSTQIGMGLRSVFLVFFERLFVWGMFASGYQAFFPKACRRGWLAANILSENQTQEGAGPSWRYFSGARSHSTSGYGFGLAIQSFQTVVDLLLPMPADIDRKSRVPGQ